MDVLHLIGNRSMRWKAPAEDPNTGHAVAVDVRDTKQLMPSCPKDNWRFLSYSVQIENGRSGIQGSNEYPTPVSKVSHGLGRNGCVAEKVACKADRVTPASCNKVTLMTDGSNSDEVYRHTKAADSLGMTTQSG